MIFMLETEGINCPLCLKEQAISQVLHPPQVGISNIIIENLLNKNLIS
jgi:hypothetical protein